MTDSYLDTEPSRRGQEIALSTATIAEQLVTAALERVNPYRAGFYYALHIYTYKYREIYYIVLKHIFSLPPGLVLLLVEARSVNKRYTQ